MRPIEIIKSLTERYCKSDLAKRMLSGTFWSFTGTAAAKFIVLLAGILCARILGKEGYGELGIIRSTISVFITLGIAGLGVTATKFISEYRNDSISRIPSIYSVTALFSILLAIVTSLCIILLADVIAEKSLHSPFLTQDLQWGGILIFFTILNGIQNGVLTGFEQFRTIAMNTLWGSIAESVFMCVGAYYWNVTGAILGYGIGYIVIFIFNRIAIKRIFKKYNISGSLFAFDKKDLSILYKFSLPTALASLLVAPVYWIIKSLLVRVDGYSQLAIFEAADQWKIIILFIPSAISNVVLPILSSIVNENTKDFWRVLRINIYLNAGISLVLTLVICLFGSFIMDLYGKDFGGSATLIILCASTVFTSISTVVGLSISSRNKMWIGFGFNLLWALMLTGFSYLFIYNGMGATGLAAAILCSYAIHSIFQLLYLKHIVKTKTFSNQ